jgi:hypothetical protein
MEKKIALLLFGISKQKYTHWSYNNPVYYIDYENSFDNYQEYIFKYFESKGYSIDIYFSTNILCESE